MVGRGLPRGAEPLVDLLDVEALAEGSAGVADEQVGVELARRDDAVTRRRGEADLTLVRRADRVGPVGVADGLDAEVGVGQRVGEQAQLGVVGLAGVDPLQRGPRERDVAAVGAHPRATLEDVARRRPAGLLAEGELLAVDQRVGRGAGAGGDREVGRAGVDRALTPRGAMSASADSSSRPSIAGRSWSRTSAHVRPGTEMTRTRSMPVSRSAGIVGVLRARRAGRRGDAEHDRERQGHGEHGVRPSGQAGHHGLDRQGIRRV